MTGVFCSKAGECPIYQRFFPEIKNGPIEPVLNYDGSRNRPYRCDALKKLWEAVRIPNSDIGLTERIAEFGLECKHLMNLNTQLTPLARTE